MFEAEKKAREFSDNFKRKIIAEIVNTGVTAASVARRNNINASQIYKWKKIYGSEVGFVPVSVAEPKSPSKNPIVNSCITITLGNGSCIEFEGDYDLSDIARLAQGLSS